jgi:hypothetical protein
MSLWRWFISCWSGSVPTRRRLTSSGPSPPQRSQLLARAWRWKRHRFRLRQHQEPKPPAPAVCTECQGRGYIVMPDGHRVQCGECKGTGKGCPDGKCPKKP